MPDRVGAPTRQLLLYTAILQLSLVNGQEKRFFFFLNVSYIYSVFLCYYSTTSYHRADMAMNST